MPHFPASPPNAVLPYGGLPPFPLSSHPRYTNLRKPRWNPPNWVFPIMWIPLKILQVGAWRLRL